MLIYSISVNTHEPQSIIYFINRPCSARRFAKLSQSCIMFKTFSGGGAKMTNSGTELNIKYLWGCVVVENQSAAENVDGRGTARHAELHVSF